MAAQTPRNDSANERATCSGCLVALVIVASLGYAVEGRTGALVLAGLFSLAAGIIFLWRLARE